MGKIVKIALITIATGKTYRDYARRMLDSACRFMPAHDQFLFGDKFEAGIPSINCQRPGAYQWKYTEPKGYPRETLMRYHTILTEREKLIKYDQIFYVDADMEFVAPVGDIFSTAGLVAVLHPGYVGSRGTPETRLVSTARCDYNHYYFAGGFQGGNAAAYIWAAENMAQNISEDEQHGVTAIWHDESHWNKYLASFEPPSLMLGPSYCYPEDYYGQYNWSLADHPPILVALDKRKRGNHPRFQ